MILYDALEKMNPKIGLRTRGFKTILTNIQTGEKCEFDSIAKAMRFLGYYTSNYQQNITRAVKTGDPMRSLKTFDYWMVEVIS